MKGEFENRLKSVIDEVQASPTPIIMFIDETHTLVGAGGAAGTGDAANLLKPALARGTLRTIGATTWAEYKKHIEKDPALTRRFQTVVVDEPEPREGDHDDARHRLDAGKAPQGAGAGRGDRGGGEPVGALHPGAATARQVGLACSTPPARGWRSASSRCRPRSTIPAGGSARWRPNLRSSAATRPRAMRSTDRREAVSQCQGRGRGPAGRPDRQVGGREGRGREDPRAAREAARRRRAGRYAGRRDARPRGRCRARNARRRWPN